MHSLMHSLKPRLALGLALLAALGLASAPAHAQNLVTNPGFETGDFTGYTHSGNLGFAGVSNNGYYVHSGTYGAALGPIGSDGFLTQDLATQAGQTYDISFFLKGDGRGPNDFNVSFDGNTLFSQTDLPDTGGFEQVNLVGVASGVSTPLTFGFRKDPGYFGLDDISVTAAPAVPEASTTASFGLLLALGVGGMVIAAKRKRAAASL